MGRRERELGMSSRSVVSAIIEIDQQQTRLPETVDQAHKPTEALFSANGKQPGSVSHSFEPDNI